MRYLINLIYLALLLAASPWLLWSAFRHGKYRQGWPAKLLGLVTRNRDPQDSIWFHAVSVGEVQLLEVLIAEVRRRWPQTPLVISTTSRTGFALAQKKYPDLIVSYAPLDFSWAVDHAIRRWRPRMIVLAELEVWPNWIAAANRRGIPVCVVNGRLSARSAAGYRRLQPWIRKMFQGLHLVAVQNDAYRRRFLELGAKADRVVTTGSLKFERATLDRDNPTTRALAQQFGITASDTIFLAGSTQEPEDVYALNAFTSCLHDFPALRLVLVPRHPERFDDVAEACARSGLRWQRRTGADGEVNGDWQVLLVDTVGELGDWWGTADIGFVGGSFGDRGGQNMLEPAAFGVATCFGPRTENFREISDALVAAGGAEVVPDAKALTAFVRRCLDDPPYRHFLGSAATAFVESQTGATQRTMELLSPRLPNQERHLRLEVGGDDQRDGCASSGEGTSPPARRALWALTAAASPCLPRQLMRDFAVVAGLFLWSPVCGPLRNASANQYNLGFAPARYSSVNKRR